MVSLDANGPNSLNSQSWDILGMIPVRELAQVPLPEGASSVYLSEHVADLLTSQLTQAVPSICHSFMLRHDCAVCYSECNGPYPSTSNPAIGS